jgi:integrase
MSRGDGRIYLRGQIYWVCYYLRGVQHRESTETSDAKQAAKFLKARLREVGADLLGARAFTTPKASRLTVAELCQALKTKYELLDQASSQNLCHLKRCETDFGHYRALALKSEKINEYMNGRKADGDAHATINRTTGMLLQCYELGVKHKKFSRFEVPKIEHLDESENVRKGFFTEAEIAGILENLPADLRDFVRWLAYTGMRTGEAKLLTWDMVVKDDDGDEVLQIPADICKNAVARPIPLGGELAEIIKRRQSARTVTVDGRAEMCEFIFHRNGEMIGEFRKSWVTACKKAGCPGRILHDFRRTAAKNLIKSGVPVPVAKLWTGHKSDSMFFRYAILDLDDMRKAQAQVEQYRKAVATSKQTNVVAIGGGR